MTTCDVLEDNLVALGITFESEKGTRNLLRARTPDGRDLEIHYKQRIERGNRFRFHFEPGTYAKGDQVFMVCHNGVQGKTWVLPQAVWDRLRTEAGYCATETLEGTYAAGKYLGNFKVLLGVQP